MAFCRLVLDSNAIDPLIDIAGLFERVQQKVSNGEAELLYTHITIDELSAVPDLERRSRLILAVCSLGRLVPTGAFVLDYSRLGYARLSDDRDAFEAFRAGNRRHTRDALIVATAAAEGATLMTADRGCAHRAQSRGLSVASSLVEALHLDGSAWPAGEPG